MHNFLIYFSIILAILGAAMFVSAVMLKPKKKQKTKTAQKTKEQIKETKEKPKRAVKPKKKTTPAVKPKSKQKKKSVSKPKHEPKQATKKTETTDKKIVSQKDTQAEQLDEVKSQGIKPETIPSETSLESELKEKTKRDEVYTEEVSDETEQEAPKQEIKKKSKLSIGFGKQISQILQFFKGGKLSEQEAQKIEEILLSSDIGYDNTQKIIANIKENYNKKEGAEELLKKTLVQFLKIDKPLNIVEKTKPTVILVVGVNGVGKTTTIGKIGMQLKNQNKSVVFGAADTFRAAAIDQLQEWGRKTNIDVVANVSTDSAAVAYKTVEKAINEKIDYAIIDTAGRLTNKVNLMDEIQKVHRVINKLVEVSEVLLVLDATVGQNGLVQSESFYKAVETTGIVLTKLDGSAKGGIIFSIQNELNIPVKFIGVGEKVDDLKPFNPNEFVEQLF